MNGSDIGGGEDDDALLLLPHGAEDDCDSGGERCQHPLALLRRALDGSVVCSACGSVLEGEHRAHFFRHCAAQTVSPPPAYTLPGEATGNTYVGADGRARTHFPRSTSSAMKKLIAEPRQQELSLRFAEDEVRKLAARHALSSSVAAEILDAMRRVIASNARVWNRGVYGTRITAAVAYIVCRRHNLPLTMAEVADFQGCTTSALKRAYKRVLPLLGDQVELLDPSAWLKRAAHLMVADSARTSAAAAAATTTDAVDSKVLEDKTERVHLLAQAIYRLVVVPRALGLGRRPLPLVAATVALAMEAVDARDTFTHLTDTERVLGARKKAAGERYEELICAFMALARQMVPHKVGRKELARVVPTLLAVCPHDGTHMHLRAKRSSMTCGTCCTTGNEQAKQRVFVDADHRSNSSHKHNRAR